VRVAKQAHCPFVVSSRTHGDFLGVSQTLLVFAKQQETGGELKVASQATEDGQLLISVSDTGCGLPADQPERIFKPFFTAKAQGTGMGLSISRRIVESHGGRLWATAKADRGTILQFTLPSNATAG
jgi:signal transduction histidine kinase